MQTIVTLIATENIMEFDVLMGVGATLGKRIGSVRQTSPDTVEGITARGFWETYTDVDAAVRGVLYPVVGETVPVVAFGTRD